MLKMIKVKADRDCRISFKLEGNKYAFNFKKDIEQEVEDSLKEKLMNTGLITQVSKKTNQEIKN